MKKILFILPLILCIFIIGIDCVFATDFNNLDDFYDYISDTYNIDEAYLDSDDFYLDYSNILNNSDFLNFLNSHPYYCIFPYCNTLSKRIYVNIAVSDYPISFSIYESYSGSNEFCYGFNCQGSFYGASLYFNNNFGYYLGNPVNYTNLSNATLDFKDSTFNLNSMSSFGSSFYLYQNSKLNISKDFLLNNIKCNFDMKYYGTDNVFISDTTVVTPSVDVSCVYSNDNSSATISLSSNIPNSTIYYEFSSVLHSKYNEEEYLGVIASGAPKNFFKLYTEPIIYTKNDSLYWCLFDSNGNELARDSYRINGILNIPDFSVSFIHDIGYSNFIPYLNVPNSDLYDIYCYYTSDYNVELDNSSDVVICSSTKNSSHVLLDSGSLYKLVLKSLSSAHVSLNFEIHLKNNNDILFSRTFDLQMFTSTITKVTNSKTNNINDNTIDYGGNKENGLGNYLNNNLYSQNGDFDLNTSITTAKNFFTGCISFFNMIIVFLNMFPAWLFVPISILLTMLVIITIIKIIRG